MAIKEPNIQTAVFKIIGTAPYVQARFSAKAMQAMRTKHELGSLAKKGGSKEARNFENDYQQAIHRTSAGWIGIPAGAFRQAMISACRLVGFKMTLAKLSLFIEADGFDAVDAMPLVRIMGEPENLVLATRNQTGVADLRARPMWKAGEWSATVRVRFDGDQFSKEDVRRLMSRVGMQVGIGEGRPDSKESAGLGWGTFDVEVIG